MIDGHPHVHLLVRGLHPDCRLALGGVMVIRRRRPSGGARCLGEDRRDVTLCLERRPLPVDSVDEPGSELVGDGWLTRLHHHHPRAEMAYSCQVVRLVQHSAITCSSHVAASHSNKVLLAVKVKKVGSAGQVRMHTTPPPSTGIHVP